MNAGFDGQETIVKLVEERTACKGKVPVGLDITSGEPCNPQVMFTFYS